jgi:hypothetical protein
MVIHSPSSIDAFTAPERDIIRRELGQHFGSFPSVAEGMFLRVWRGGPLAGKPKLPPAIQTMMARGLVEIQTDRGMPRAFFTQAGLAALRQLAKDRRLLDPVRYAHIRHELGLQTEQAAAAE